jgi:2-C-methyl-D-erythritol 4-phosphate cytidylyltransferase
MPKEYAIITAGGTGSRMGSDVPKQFLELKGVAVIVHSIKAFQQYSPDINIVIVLPDGAVEHWTEIAKKYGIDAKTCMGGETRFDSVKNGLELIDDGLVAVHDAARPLVTPALISQCFLVAAQEGNAVPVIPLTDSMRELSNDISRPAERERFKLVQTPQVFEASLLKKAYEQAYRSSFTDDATVVEAFGAKIHLVDGEKSNIKITTKTDMLIAKALLPGTHRSSDLGGLFLPFHE